MVVRDGTRQYSDIECHECGGDVCEHHKYVELNGKFFHWDCLENLNGQDVIELLGLEIHDGF